MRILQQRIITNSSNLRAPQQQQQLPLKQQPQPHQPKRPPQTPTQPMQWQP